MSAQLQRLLIVADQLPFPARNGVTLPLVNWVRQLRSTHDIRFLLLRPEDQPVTAEARTLNERELGAWLEVSFVREAPWRRIAGELLGRSMYQHGWRVWRVEGLAALAADWRTAPVLVSPIGALAKWRALRANAPALRPAVTLAAVHDCTTAEYRWRYRSPQPGLLGAVKAWSHLLRAPLIARVEARLLADAHGVLVQTEADRKALRTLVGPETAARALVVRNGVRGSLLDLAVEVVAQPPTVLFVAELSGEYAATAQWLCESVWPLVRARVPHARLQVVGRGAPPRLLAVLASAAGVMHQDYVADLDAVYAGSSLVWSPLWKGFGLINKTLEGMAAARPVVGGRAAFNGIDGFVSGQHGVGLQSANAEVMADATVSLMLDAQRSQAMGRSARELVRSAFRWELAAESIRAALAGRPVTTH